MKYVAQIIFNTGLKIDLSYAFTSSSSSSLGLFFIGKVDYYVVLERYLYVGPVDKLL